MQIVSVLVSRTFEQGRVQNWFSEAEDDPAKIDNTHRHAELKGRSEPEVFRYLPHKEGTWRRYSQGREDIRLKGSSESSDFLAYYFRPHSLHPDRCVELVMRPSRYHLQYQTASLLIQQL